jgi:hypothetical protein
VPDPRLDELWQEVMASWGDDAAHAVFVEHCRSSQKLGQAASRYREEIRRGSAYREDAGRVEAAQKRLDGVIALAMIELESARTPREETGAHHAVVVIRWVTLLLCVAIVLFSMVRFILR